MLVAFVSMAHAVAASTSSTPTPRPRTCGATHIETSSTIGDDGSSRYPPTRPTRSSSSCAKKVARPLPREPATDRWTHSASGRFASDRYVEPNADGASSRAASRTCFRRAASRVVMRRTSTPTASSEAERWRNWVTTDCPRTPVPQAALCALRRRRARQRRAAVTRGQAMPPVVSDNGCRSRSHRESPRWRHLHPRPNLRTHRALALAGSRGRPRALPPYRPWQ